VGSHLRWLRSRRGAVEHAIDDLASGKSKRRSDAAIWIWSRQGERFTAEERTRCIQALTPVAVADPDAATRGQAIAALVSLEAPGVADLVLAALEDPDWGVRMIVAGEIGPVNDPRVVDALVRLLGDEDGFVRESAAIGLEQQGEPRALGPLRAMEANERDSAARKRARHAIRVLAERDSNRSESP